MSSRTHHKSFTELNQAEIDSHIDGILSEQVSSEARKSALVYLRQVADRDQAALRKSQRKLARARRKIKKHEESHDFDFSKHASLFQISGQTA